MKKLLLITCSLLVSVAGFCQDLEPGVEGTLTKLTPVGVNITNSDVGSGGVGRNTIAIGNKLLFVGTDATYGEELWITDGTVQGTELLKDINPGDVSSSPLYFTASGGKVFFSAYTESAGQELWVTDGTPLGTRMVTDIYPLVTANVPESSSPDMITAYNGKVIFRAIDEFSDVEGDPKKYLWISDGTEPGTEFIKEIEPLNSGNAGGRVEYTYIQVANNLAFFIGQDTKYGNELWVTDGTPDGTKMVLDITFEEDLANPGNTLSTDFEWFWPANDEQIIFQAYTPSWWLQDDYGYESLGGETWVSDGTPWGTYQLGDYNTAENTNTPTATQGAGLAYFWNYDHRVFGRAKEPLYNNELVTVDLNNGIQHMANICGPNSKGKEQPSYISEMCVFDSTLFFAAASNQLVSGIPGVTNVGRELFAYTAQGDSTFLAHEFVEGKNNNEPKQLMVVNNRMYLKAKDASEKFFMYCVKPRIEDPTRTPFKFYNETGGTDVNYSNFINVGENLFFVTEYNNGVEIRRELYVYDDGRAKEAQDDRFAVGPSPTTKTNHRITVVGCGETCPPDDQFCFENCVSSNKRVDMSFYNVYPNPATDVLVVDVKDNEQANIVLFNASGILVWSSKVQGQAQIDMSSLSAGMYMMHVTTGSESSMTQILLVK